MSQTARRASVATAVVLAVVVAALALWKLKMLALLFLAFTIAAACVRASRRSSDRGSRGASASSCTTPPSPSLGLLLWAVVPRAVTQVQNAIGNSEEETGIKRDVLGWLEQRLDRLPRPEEVVDPALALLFGGFAVLVAIPMAAVVATLFDVIVRDKDPGRRGRPDRALPGPGR